MRALRRTHYPDKHLLAAPPMSTMTEGAVDALEELDFDPVCDYCRPVLCACKLLAAKRKRVESQ